MLTIPLAQSVNISISATVAPSLSFIKFNTLFCFSDFIFSVSISNSISSLSFFRYTQLIVLSWILFSLFLFLVPGVNINLIQSDTLQKYLFAIHFASAICLSVKFSSNLDISFTSNCDVSFNPTTNASVSFPPLPKGTNTLLPTNISSSNSFGML